MTESTPKVVVIGIGNEFRGDDAVGVVVARALQKGPLPSFVRVVEAGLAGPGLLDIWLGADLAIVVDAVKVEGEAEGGIFLPGSVVEFGTHEILMVPDLLCCDPTSSHGFTLGEAVKLASALGYPYMPREFRVIGVCVDSGNLALGSGKITPGVEQGCEAAAGVIRQMIMCSDYGSCIVGVG